MNRFDKLALIVITVMLLVSCAFNTEADSEPDTAAADTDTGAVAAKYIHITETADVSDTETAVAIAERDEPAEIETVELNENELIEQALIDKAMAAGNYWYDCKITHYCTCKKCCGKSESDPAYGITACGQYGIPYLTAGVDTNVIPFGSDILVDYGDGTGIHYLKAMDTGSGVKGHHLDLLVSSHQEAINEGVKYAQVWWIEPEE